MTMEVLPYHALVRRAPSVPSQMDPYARGMSPGVARRFVGSPGAPCPTADVPDPFPLGLGEAEVADPSSLGLGEADVLNP
jgi:hypothetical protein